MRFATGALVTLVAKGFALIIGVATSVITARALGPEGRGILALLVFFQGLTVTFGMLGMNGSITYFMARDPGRARKIVENAVVSAVGGGVAVAFLLWGLAEFVPGLVLGRVDIRYLKVFLVSIPFTFLSQILQNVYLAKQRFIDFNVLDLLLRAIQLGGYAVVLIWLGGSTLEAVVVFSGAAVVGGVIYTAWTMRVEPFRWNFDPLLFREMFTYSVKTYGASLLMFLVYRVHLLMINLMQGQSAAGIYSVGLQLVDVIYIVPVTLSLVLFPKISANEDPGALLMLRVFRTTLVVMTMLCALVAWFGREIIALLFGVKFMEASEVLVWLAPGIVALSLVNVLGADLTARGLFRSVIKSIMFGLIAMLLGLSWVLPRFGLAAAAMVATAGYFLIIAVLLVQVRSAMQLPWSAFFRIRRSDLKFESTIWPTIDGSRGSRADG